MKSLPQTLAPLVLGCVAMLPLANAWAETTVTILRELESERYDPPRTTARGAAEVLFMAGDTLVGLDYDMKTPVPAVVKSWTVSPDGLTYTFQLRQDVTFCSGKKMTAKDVVATYDHWLDPETKGLEKWRAGPVDSITAPDDYTVVYKLKQPYNELLTQMAHYMHTIINIDQVKALGKDFGVKAFDGTGPYCFVSWTPRDQVVLKRHEGYDWGPAIYKDPRPKVDRIVWKIVPEESTRLTAVQGGQADLSRYLPQWSIKDLKADKRLSVSKADPFYWTFFLGFKLDKPVLADVNVRRALNLAINRKALTEAITFGEATPATSMLATSTPAGKNEYFRYDPAEANRLLDAAGWKMSSDGYRYKDGQKLSILHYGIAGYWKDILEAVQGDMKKVGAELRVQLFDSTAAWGKLATQEFDEFSMSFGYMSTGEALNSYFLSSSIPVPNRMNWRDADTDRWLAEGAASLDPAKADATLSQALTKLSEAAVWIPLYHDSLYLVAGQRLKPVRAHGIFGTGTYKGLDIELK
ncbi:peptide ABC transporter substrate-binding protein [Bordetella genomosp. 10]|uniref:Peptide ABC transporter substrate-binding protein n=1 Tax=Bordetella genomosp. 10 TaxID=1416804 RepID=A0A261SKE9_9BORD|nr:ABC transporter substrate-binding protein [Bordetella genomosp. 10]OZI37422.1 peptide ABC transporter substrate-binding protein [Bordetella genomosp. 10]